MPTLASCPIVALPPVYEPSSPLVSRDVLNAIPQQRQTQAATNDQLRALIEVSNRLGLYDAADFLTKITNKR